MKNKRFFLVWFSAIIIFFSFVIADFSYAKGGKSSGGSRSFGGSRSTSSPQRVSPPATNNTQRQAAPSSSFGGSRSVSKPPTNAPAANNMSSSIGGARNYNHDYSAKYGAPRRTITSNQMPGLPNNYRVNDYGGFSSGLMTGYLMGSTSMMWSMPFHPAFYYSRPTYYNNPDGTVSVYPPTFSFMKLFMGIIIFVVVLALIIWIFRKIKRARSGGDSYSQSSFS
jgi:hypothetical protein